MPNVSLQGLIAAKSGGLQRPLYWNGRPLSDEAVAEALLRAVKQFLVKQETFQSDSHFWNWVRLAARRIEIGMHRTKEKFNTYKRTVESAAEERESAVPPRPGRWSAEDQRACNTAFEMLPQRQRRVLFGAYHLDLKGKRLAEFALGCSSPTSAQMQVLYRLRKRALKNLEKLLGTPGLGSVA